MKAIIFDMDNTLITWKDEYVQELFKLLKAYGINDENNLYLKVDSCLVSCKKILKILKKEDLLNYVNEECHLNLPLKFIDDLIIAQGNCFEVNESLIELIKYLSEKYDLFVVSNWFTETQILRLKGMKIMDYFKGVYGGDIGYIKPNVKCYDPVLKHYNPKDIYSVGDSLENDIIIPASIGMMPIWITKEKSEEFKTIENINELKRIL